MKNLTVGLKPLLYSVAENKNAFNLIETVKSLLFPSITTPLEKEMLERLSKARTEFFDGNMRTETAFADAQLARHILTYYDSNKIHFEQLVYKCRQHFQSNDNSKKFSPDNYYLNADLGKTNIYDKFLHITDSTNLSQSQSDLLSDFTLSFKRNIDEKFYDRALAMLILYSILNTDVFYLNWQFKRIDYCVKPCSKIQDDNPYLIKPYLDKDSHLKINNSFESVNHTVDHSCINRPILINSNDIYMNSDTSIFEFKKAKGNTYYIKQNNKYLQWLGITSNTRLVLDEELNHRCRWKLTYVEDAQAFIISPYVNNRIIRHYSALDIPNGAIHAENLPLWIFLKNTTRSQLFRLHTVNNN